jgi:hypothetical protein
MLNRLSANIFFIILFFFLVGYTQTADSLRQNNDSQKTAGTSFAKQPSDSTTTIDSSKIKAFELDKKRLLIASIDDSITKCKNIRSLCVLGMVVGCGVTVTGLVLSQIDAQKKADEQAMRTGQPAIVIAWNLPGILVGIPLSIFCGYKYVSLGSTISILEWKKKKIGLSYSGNSMNLTASF